MLQRLRAWQRTSRAAGVASSAHEHGPAHAAGPRLAPPTSRQEPGRPSELLVREFFPAEIVRVVECATL